MTNRKNILVVDDELDVQHLFKQMFRKEIKSGEIIFDFAFSGEEALLLLKKKEPADIVLILSDINMPGMNGLELLKNIKKDYSHLKVFMITAYSDEENYREAVTNGADDYLNKPLDFENLKNKILSIG
ncbi:MAG: response regulator [Ignavibacteriaceae bacterium]